MRLIRVRAEGAYWRSRGSAFLRGSKDLEPADVEVLYPEEIRRGCNALYLPGQLEKLRGTAFQQPIADEIASLRGGPRTIQATTRLEFQNVFLRGGNLCRNGQRKTIGRWSTRPRLNDAVFSYSESAMRSSFLGSHFFGHWLRDDCATHLLTKAVVSPPVSVTTPPWPGKELYSKLFQQSYVELSWAFFNRLHIYDDISQNAHKAERFNVLRRQLKRFYPLGPDTGIAFLRRGRSGTPRDLVNEAEILETLVRKGVRIVEAESETIAQDLLNARLVIGVEGSQLSHAVYTLRDGGGIIAIQPEDRFHNSHFDWANSLGLRYGIVVAEKRELGFHLAMDDLLRTIELFD